MVYQEDLDSLDLQVQLVNQAKMEIRGKLVLQEKRALRGTKAPSVHLGPLAQGAPREIKEPPVHQEIKDLEEKWGVKALRERTDLLA